MADVAIDPEICVGCEQLHLRGVDWVYCRLAGREQEQEYKAKHGHLPKEWMPYRRVEDISRVPFGCPFRVEHLVC